MIGQSCKRAFIPALVVAVTLDRNRATPPLEWRSFFIEVIAYIAPFPPHMRAKIDEKMVEYSGNEVESSIRVQDLILVLEAVG